MKLIDYVNNIKHHKHPRKFLLSKLLTKTKFSNKINIKHHGFQLKFHHDSELARKIWIEKKFLGNAEKFILDYLKPNDVLIDIGSNIGIISLHANTLIGNSGKIYAIEPHPQTFRNLQDNIKLNKLKNIISINSALGNKKSEIRFTDLRSDCMNYVQLNNKNGITVPVSKLDDILINETSIDLIKIDVEGYEKFVFEGSDKTLEKTKCIFYESLDRLYKRYDYTHKEIFTFLTQKGFQIFRIQNKTISLLINHELSPKDWNLIAIRDLSDFLERTNYSVK